VGCEPRFTAKDRRGERCLDYLFCAGTMRVLATLSMPHAANLAWEAGREDDDRAAWDQGWEGGSFGWMPNVSWPSDHLAVGVEVVLPARHADE